VPVLHLEPACFHAMGDDALKLLLALDATPYADPRIAAIVSAGGAVSSPELAEACREGVEPEAIDASAQRVRRKN